MWQGRWADAADDFSEAAALHPGDWRAQYNLGKCLMKLDDSQRASEVLAIAQSLQPTNTEISDAYAEALLACGNRNLLYTFLQNQAQEQQTVYAWERFAEYAMGLDDPDSATNAINTAIAISDGTNASPYITAAEFAERMGDDALAIKHWRQAWVIDPTNTTVGSAIRSHGEVPGPTMTGAVNDSE